MKNSTERRTGAPGFPVTKAALALAIFLLLPLTGCHQVHEARARKLSRSALEHFQQGDLDRALEHSEIALRLGADEPMLYRMRASIFLRQGDAGQALTEADAGLAGIAVINANPDHPSGGVIDEDQAEFHSLRSTALLALGRIEEGREAQEETLRLNPDHIGVLNNLAWLLATVPRDSIRDGKRAVELAAKACELTEWKAVGAIDTLAAAHAEAGNFEEAVKWQKKAIELGAAEGSEEELAPFRARLKLFQSAKPYRESPAAEFKSRAEERAAEPAS